MSEDVLRNANVVIGPPLAPTICDPLLLAHNLEAAMRSHVQQVLVEHNITVAHFSHHLSTITIIFLTAIVMVFRHIGYTTASCAAWGWYAVE